MKQYFFLFCIGLLLLLSGCGHFIEWGKQTIPQGESLPIDLTLAQSYIRSVCSYDQFTLIANFDVLWLSTPVRELHTNVLVRSLGKGTKEQEQIAMRVKEDIKHYITFYVLSPYDIVLGDPQSLWSLLLEIDDVLYRPADIKLIADLHPIYIALFGKRVMRFCNVYQVKFDALTFGENLSIISERTKSISLLFRSIDRELRVNWKLS